jgi:hypothetical protein
MERDVGSTARVSNQTVLTAEQYGIIPAPTAFLLEVTVICFTALARKARLCLHCRGRI